MNIKNLSSKFSNLKKIFSLLYEQSNKHYQSLEQFKKTNVLFHPIFSDLNCFFSIFFGYSEWSYSRGTSQNWRFSEKKIIKSKERREKSAASKIQYLVKKNTNQSDWKLSQLVAGLLQKARLLHHKQLFFHFKMVHIQTSFVGLI